MNPSHLCQTLQSGLPKLFDCSLAPQGAVRVRTPFMYPDGDLVDLFVEGSDEDFLITDYGEALGWLRSHSFSDRITANQRSLAEDVCLTLGVELDRGQVSVRREDPSDLPDAIHILGQAAVRLSDIWFTLKTRSVTTVADEVAEWLLSRRFNVQRNFQEKGRSGRAWTVDYRVVAEAKTSLVFLLNTVSQDWARRMSERVVAVCTDLSYMVSRDHTVAFVSLFNDKVDVWRDEDFALVQPFSRIATWSKPNELEAILTTEWAPISPFVNAG